MGVIESPVWVAIIEVEVHEAVKSHDAGRLHQNQARGAKTRLSGGQPGCNRECAWMTMIGTRHHTGQAVPRTLTHATETV